MNQCNVYVGKELAKYGFGDDHPFSNQRHHAFLDHLKQQDFVDKINFKRTNMCQEKHLRLFHTPEYIEEVKAKSNLGIEPLDKGMTPSYKGVFEAASTVVGTSLRAFTHIVEDQCKTAFVPIAGLHHARRHKCSGFCVFNDAGVVIKYARKKYNMKRFLYVDIDAHHGDGLYYEFASDPDVWILDIHQDGKTIFPHTGDISETGVGKAKGTKVNIPMPVCSTDLNFIDEWEKVQSFLDESKPDFILLNVGADSIKGDPLTNMMLSVESYVRATCDLMDLADQYCKGRVLALGGGGYSLENLAKTWTEVVRVLAKQDR